VFKRFLYFLTEVDGRSLKDQNGVVSATNTRTPLDPTPDGWMDVSFGFERDLETLGNVETFSAPSKFFRQSAKILRNENYKRNIERRLFLLITKLFLEVDLANNTYKRYYKTIWKTELDFSTAEDNETYIVVNSLQGGISQQLKANKTTVYPISMDDPERIKVKWDGVDIYFNKTFTTTSQSFSSSCQSPFNPNDTSNYLVGFFKAGEEGTNVNIATADNLGGPIPDSYDLSTLDGWFMKAVGPVNIENSRLKFKFLVAKTANGTGGLCRFRLVKSTGAVVAVFANINFTGAFYSQINEVDIPLSFSLNTNEKLFLLLELQTTDSLLGSGVPVSLNVSILETTCVFNFKSKFKTTYPKFLKGTTVFRKLVKSFSGNEDNAVSDLLSQNANLVFSCVNAVRSLPGSVMKVSTLDFFKFWRIVKGAGMGAENDKVRIEKYEYFFDPSSPIDLGEVKNCKISWANDLRANTFKFGYPEQSYENVNGKYEYNNTLQFGTPITRIIKEGDFVCPIRTDSYGLEILRVNMDGKTTTDNDSDNDVCCVNVNKDPISFVATGLLAFDGGTKGFGIQGADGLLELLESGDRFILPGTINAGTYTVDFVEAGIGGFNVYTLEPTLSDAQNDVTILSNVYELAREVYDNATTDIGIPSPSTSFNIKDLTPKRIVLQQGPWINSMMYGFEGQKLPFLGTEKNDKLKTVQGATVIQENADYTVGNTRIFIPRYFDFESDVSADVLELLAQNPNRCFRFTWKGITYKGFMMKMGISPDTSKDQVFKLLSTPDNDFSKQIR
jgi:hypothetical protein